MFQTYDFFEYRCKLKCYKTHRLAIKKLWILLSSHVQAATNSRDLLQQRMVAYITAQLHAAVLHHNHRAFHLTNQRGYLTTKKPKTENAAVNAKALHQTLPQDFHQGLKTTRTMSWVINRPMQASLVPARSSSTLLWLEVVWTTLQ